MQERLHEFLKRWNELERNIKKLKIMEAQKLGLKVADLMILLELSQEGLSNADLSRRCDLDKAAVTRSLKELDKLGYIHRFSNSSGKRYGSKLVLSPLGNQMMLDLSKTMDRIVKQSSADLSEQQRQQFYATLTEIAQNIRRLNQEKEKDHEC